MLGDLDNKIKSWIEKPEVLKALHVKPGSKWIDADETGPVSDNLKSDFTKSVMPEVEYILNRGYKMLM